MPAHLVLAWTCSLGKGGNYDLRGLRAPPTISALSVVVSEGNHLKSCIPGRGTSGADWPLG